MIHVTMEYYNLKNSCKCTSSGYQATFLFPCGIGTRQLFHTVSWTGVWERSLMFSYVRLLVVYMSSNTDHCDVTCLDLLSKLLYPRGLSKKAVFIKHFEVCVTTTSLFTIMIALFPALCCLKYSTASSVTGIGREILSCTVMSC